MINTQYPPLPPPAPIKLPPSPVGQTPPGFAVRLVLAIRKALVSLTNFFTPSELVVIEKIASMGFTHCLGSVALYGIPDILENNSLTAEEIAQRANLNPDMVHRTMRFLASHGVFSMDSNGRFSNNRLSNVLKSEGLSSLKDYAVYFASGSNSAAWANFSTTLSTGKSAFDHVHQASVWEWFEAHDDERETFAHTMTRITLQTAPQIATAYPFKEIKTVCDVGGGRGTLLSELLIRHQHLQGILCDSPGVSESAKTLLSSRGVLDRVKIVPGSFFHSVAKGADLYVLKHILHDWDDTASQKILSTVREAMTPGARLIVCETMVEKNELNAMTTLADLQMAVACSQGRERNLEEFRKLLESSGYKLGRVFHHPVITVIESIAV